MIRADGDALVDVLLVVRVVDPVLEVEELRVGERRDLHRARLPLHAVDLSRPPRHTVDAMLSRTCSRHGTPSTRRAKKDAGAPTLSVKFVLKFPVANASDASRPAKKP